MNSKDSSMHAHTGPFSRTCSGAPPGALPFFQRNLIWLTLVVLAACSGEPPVEAQRQPDSTAHAEARASLASEPQWKPTGGMAQGRLSPTATRLVDGRVLAVGGFNWTTELYDPATGAWSPTGNTHATHREHTATRLADGRVLVAGGKQDQPLVNNTEVYDLATGHWSPTGGLVTPRSRHAALLLPSGQVLVMGGTDSAGTVVSSAELYNPATGTWTPTGAMSAPRSEHTATLLPSGKVLVAGGRQGSGTLRSAELYDPATGTWMAAGSLLRPRRYHTATLLPSGKVLVAGSDSAEDTSARSSELYDPATGTWTATGDMSKPRRYHTATLLPSGQVLVAGGFHEHTGISFSAELYDGATGTWSATASMSVDRYGHTATLLSSGAVLAAGGFTNHDKTAAELYTPTAPPPPEPVPTPLDDTRFTPLAEATGFLYAGPNAVQVGVAPGTIEARRATVLRGQVKTRDDAPLEGVTVSLLDHPEFGHTLTRTSGMFDMVVNGGGLLTVQYKKEGYLPAQRQVRAPWADYAWLPEVILIPLDSQVTPIVLSETSGYQVAQGSVTSDVDGTRRATLLFPPGMQASVVLPDGSTRPLTTVHVRATEYTVGAEGPRSMPGALPPASGYTYAVELSVDEAMDWSSDTVVQEVRFNQPLYLYVDNFLDFPVGGLVPAGWYDRRAGVWKPSDNGRILQVLAIVEGRAMLDVTGDGVADEGGVLAELGLTDEERQRLAGLFTPGKSFWRTPVSHFTPWDCNWPYAPPEDAEPPKQEPESEKPKEDPCRQKGSIIDCHNQSLGELLPLVGTPFQLSYRSDRVPGRRTAHTLKVPLSGASVAPSLLRIELEIEVAGQRFSQTFPPTPNQTHTFEWNGRDAYGRLLQGQWPVRTRIGYVYELVYQRPAAFAQSFGRLSGVPLTATRGEREVTLWQEQTRHLGEWNVPLSNLGGWMLDVHHAYNPATQTLYLGHGARRVTGLVEHKLVARTVAGNGAPGDAGDGEAAVKASLWNPRDVAFAPDGTLYIADTLNNRIRRVGPDQRISTVPGSEEYQPHYVEVGPDGSVYAAHTYLHCIRRIRPDGTATTFAGQCGMQGGDEGDGGPATQARLNYPQDIVMGRDGNLYIADFDNDRIRYVTPEGLIHTLAGKPLARGYCGDGGPASKACLNGPWGLAIDSEGRLFFSDSYNHRIRQIGRDGLISTVAGTGVDGSSSSQVGDGGPATKALLSVPKGLAFDAPGNLYIADHTTRIRRVSPDGVMTRLAGSPEVYGNGYNGEGLPPLKALFDSPVGIAVGPDGLLYVSDEWNYRIRQVGSVQPWLAEDLTWVPSEDGRELYVFNPQNRHLRTVDALTQVVRYEFGYDAAGRLTSIQDRDGLITRIERDASGKPLAILAPHGQRTRLELDANGYLAALINPAGERTELVHTPEGLLSALRDGRGGLHEFAYDSQGRLTKDTSPAGGFKELLRTDATDGYSVVVRTALGRANTYQVQNLPTGEQRRTTVSPWGTVSLQSRNPDATTTVRSPDGTVATMEQGPDTRFGMQTPLMTSLTVKLPSGLTQTISQSRTVSLSTPEDVLSLATLTSTQTVGGRTSTLTYEAATRKLTQTSPMGKKSTTTHDEKGRVVKVEAPGLLPVHYSYDGEGRLQLLTQGTRSSSFTYQPAGYLDTVTDALSQTAGFSYDPVGRLTRQSLPGNRQWSFSHDANGNLTSLTPPEKPTHSFSYGPDDLEQDYVPPSLGGVPRVNTASQYNLDSQMRLSSYPDGATLEVNYEDGATQKTGRFSSAVLTPPGSGRYATRTRQASYTGGGYLRGLTDSQGPSVSYSYDGSLVTQVAWSGGLNGSVSYGHDTFFQVASVSVNGANAITYAYDQDGLLKQAGGLALVRDSTHGRLTRTSLGQISTVVGYNAYGETETRSAFVGATPLYTVQLARDDLGRISQKTETLQGNTHTYVYTYDTAGRLVAVREDGTLVAESTYDHAGPGNGNRTSLTQAAITRVASYDAQDRLLAFGNTTYTYGPGGDLQSRHAGNQASTYVYDAFSNLLAATLSDGTQITYVVDAQDRRVGKKVNGTLVQGFLYDGQLRVIAELDGNNQVVSRFVYATWSHSPDWMQKGGVTYRILSDERGSPRLVVKTSDGSVAQRLDYDAWGNVLSDSNPGFQPFGFAGGLYDRHTKLVRFGARDYDPEAGRWTTKDPIRFAGGDANLYAYVANDPVNAIDPSGLIVVDGFLDIGFILYDAYVILRDNVFADCGNLGSNLTALGLDAGALLIPVVTGLGPAYRAGQAGKGAEQTFEILDGVRRSKAAEVAGQSTILAEIIGSGGKVVELPLDALRSPKSVIDVTTNSYLQRWMNTLGQTLSGSKAPPILVQPGARGTPISGVTVAF